MLIALGAMLLFFASLSVFPSVSVFLVFLGGGGLFSLLFGFCCCAVFLLEKSCLHLLLFELLP